MRGVPVMIGVEPALGSGGAAAAFGTVRGFEVAEENREMVVLMWRLPAGGCPGFAETLCRRECPRQELADAASHRRGQ